MIATQHGMERVIGRTKMATQDVLSILQEGAAVRLGQSDGLEFLLFYSPPDHATKIALVSRENDSLVSVWQNDFTIPDGVSHVTRGHETRAYHAVRKYLIGQMQAREESLDLSLQIEVISGQRVVFEREAGSISRRASKSRDAVYSLAAPMLKSILEVVEEHKGEVKERFFFRVRVVHPETSARMQRYDFSPRGVRQQLSADQAEAESRP